MGGKEVVVVLAPVETTSLESMAPSSAERLSGGIQSVLSGYEARARRLFGTPAPQSSLEAMSSETTSAEAADIAREQERYFIVDVADAQAEALANELLEQPGVEAAYVKPAAENPLAPEDPTLEAVHAAPAAAPTIPDFTARQVYLAPAPAGIDAALAWGKSGGRGETVNLIDIEGGWQFTHVDLLQNSGGLIGGATYPELHWRNHGTAVLGEIGGDHNGFGVIGIAPQANLGAISHGNIGSAGAINLAAQRLRSGDVILLEMHRPGPRHGYQERRDQQGYIAVEWWPDDLLAIRGAIARGIIVIEAAGNGAENLDDTLYDRRHPRFPPSWTNPFRTPADATAAIMVGAGAPPSGAYGPDRSKLNFSNYGNRVDCQGQGEGVMTTGYGNHFRNSLNPADENYWYTGGFNGTSSASPIVAGAAACLVGIARAKGIALSPASMRQAFRNTGSPQQFAAGAPVRRIGNRPDLKALIAALRL